MTDQLTDLPLYPFETWSPVDVDPQLMRCLAENPVPRVRLATGQEVLLALRHQDVRLVLGDPRFSRAAACGPEVPSVIPQPPPGVIVNMDPPEHTRLRRLVASAFTYHRVERMRPHVQEIVDELLDTMADSGPPADVITILNPLPAIVICELLGITEEDRPRLAAFLDVMTATEEPTPEQAAAAWRTSTECVLELVERKRNKPEDDMLSALVQAHDGTDRLSQQELVMTVLTLIGGGIETTAIHLPSSLLTLFRHPDQMALLIENPELVPNAVEELLRFVPFSPALLTRVATTDVELGDVTISAGQMIIPIQTAADHDPTVFAEPDRFDITRTNSSTHTRFGYGVHFCLGAALARQEMRVAIASLLTRFPTIRLAVPDAELEFNTGHLFKPLRALPVSW